MKVILFGATGNLGREIAKELVHQGYELTVVVRNEQKAKLLSLGATNRVIADVCNSASLENICTGQDIVVSALGKSVSPNDRSAHTFLQVDFEANKNILNEAGKAGVRKFIYISAFHSERYPDLEYFKVHHNFSELLKESGIDYSIIKPPAIFSAFIDMIEMARKGQLVNIGEGSKKTNPIYEGDLAKIAVDSIKNQNTVIEAGGKTIYTRRQLNEIVQHQVNGHKRLKNIPIALFKAALPVIKIFSRNTFDKFAFFLEVMQHDTIAPQRGVLTFEEYVKMKTDGRH
jgi:uncharacterized protein YbjT (DUF2867 family)